MYRMYIYSPSLLAVFMLQPGEKKNNIRYLPGLQQGRAQWPRVGVEAEGAQCARVVVGAVVLYGRTLAYLYVDTVGEKGSIV